MAERAMTRPLRKEPEVVMAVKTEGVMTRPPQKEPEEVMAVKTEGVMTRPPRKEPETRKTPADRCSPRRRY